MPTTTTQAPPTPECGSARPAASASTDRLPEVLVGSVELATIALRDVVLQPEGPGSGGDSRNTPSDLVVDHHQQPHAERDRCEDQQYESGEHGASLPLTARRHSGNRFGLGPSRSSLGARRTVPDVTAVASSLLAQASAPNPILPEPSLETQVMMGLVTLLWIGIPIAIVAFVIRKLLLARRSAERAAPAAEHQ